MTYRESEHPRNQRNGQWTNRGDTGSDRDLTDDDAEFRNRMTRLDRWHDRQEIIRLLQDATPGRLAWTATHRPDLQPVIMDTLGGRLTPEDSDRLLALTAPGDRADAIRLLNLGDRTLTRLARTGSTLERIMVARRHHLPDHIQSMLARDPDLMVRAGIAYNTPDARLLDQLASDPAARVRHAAASNPNTPTDTLTRLAHDPDPRVRRVTAIHPNLTADDADRLAHDPDHAVRNNALRNRHCPTGTLRRTLQTGTDPDERYSAAVTLDARTRHVDWETAANDSHWHQYYKRHDQQDGKHPGQPPLG